ncbi:MAG: hypothetical protein AAFX94_08175, partial [Myxococcota bacterium]
SQALPGDVVEVAVDRASSRTVQGRVSRWIVEGESSAHPCAHVGVCTGCPLLRATESLEEQFKVERIRSWVPETTHVQIKELQRPSGLFSYRHYAKLVATERDGRLVFGSYVSGTHAVADNKGCPVLAPALAAALDDIRDRLEGVVLHAPGLRYVVGRLSRSTGAMIFVLVTSGDVGALRTRMAGFGHSLFVQLNRSEGNVLLSGELQHLSGEPTIEEELLGFGHRIGPTSFFQINPIAAEAMFRHVLNAAGSGGHCVEGYCGVGALTLPLLERFRSVSANELNSEAVGALRARGGPRLELIPGRAEDVLPAMLQGSPEAVVLDPPRRGLGEAVAQAVATCGASRVVLLSCDPRSLRSDLPILQKGYEVESITPFDQFPRTAHVETVTVLRHVDR